ncbi:MAG: exosome complex protein Rrp42 [Nanobdellota archaeon]
MNLDQKKNLIKSLKENMRLDGRGKEDYREIKISEGIAETSEGSVRVDIGKTSVLAGVKMELGSPFPDTPDEGVLMVGVELSPIANQDFESGPPGIEAIELARVTDRAIRESKSIDVKNLCVEEGEKVWVVNVDIAILNDDGNLFDACSIAAMSAIKNARFPKIEDGAVNYEEKTDEGLPLEKEPVSITVYKVGDEYVIDPFLQEMSAVDARLTVGMIDKETICSMQKGGDDTITKEDAVEMVDIATKKSEELRKLF